MTNGISLLFTFDPMYVLIVAATQMEYAPLLQKDTQLNDISTLRVDFCETGVGVMRATFALTQFVNERKPDLILQMGIAGGFNDAIPLGSVVVVKDEILADAGVEENGEWKDVFDMGFEKADVFPFEKKMLTNHYLQQYNKLQFPEVCGITLNEITTSVKRKALFQQKYTPGVESMEGAALHYVCNKMNIPYLQIRAISNYVGERDKSKWEMKKAIDNLNQIIEQLISRLAN